MTDNAKFQVLWNKGKAHLSEDGTKSFCGQYIKHSRGWSSDRPATIDEYIDEIRPRCSGCLAGAQTHRLFEAFEQIQDK